MTLTNCVVAECGADHSGGGIYAEDSSLDVTACVFRNNRCDYITENPETIGCGAGIAFVSSGAGLRIRSSAFEHNIACGRGGGLYTRKAVVSMDDSKFLGNPAMWGGGFAAYTECTVSANACTFAENTASFGGGLRIAHRTPWTLAKCTIRGNSASGGGGGINLYFAGSGSFEECSFVGNMANAGDGGAVRLQSVSLRAARCVFRENVGLTGGMASLAESSLVLEECLVAGNTPYAILAITEKELITSVNSQFGDNGNALYRVGASGRTFGSVEQLAAAFPAWKGNRSIAPSANPPLSTPAVAAAPPSAPMPVSAPPELSPVPVATSSAARAATQDMISVKTENSTFIISGVYAICSVIAALFLIGLFVLLALMKRNSRQQSSAKIVLPEDPETMHPRSR